MERDVLSSLGHQYWEFLWVMKPVYQMLLLRGACLLIWITIWGAVVRFYLATFISKTLFLQIAALLLGVIFAYSIRIENVLAYSKFAHNFWISASIMTWLILPYFLPRLILRQRGNQKISTFFIYGLEGALLLLQIILSNWD